MRLLHCQLENVRLHGELRLRFDAGITLIGGANETGKSTLVEALHRTLFLRAAATGAPVEALRSRRHPGHPTVELGFEARGGRWTVRKRFSGSSGTVTLDEQEGGGHWSGPEAEERLAGLLGVREIVGSRQAGTVLPNRWAHLWVLQGRAGVDPFAAGAEGCDLETLLDQLERAGGAALQSGHDQQVAAAVEAALAENLTSRGIRKHSPLWQQQQRWQEAVARRRQAEERLAEAEAAVETLARIESSLRRRREKLLPALQRRHGEIRRAIERAAALQAEIERRDRALEAPRLRLRGLQAVLAEQRDLDERIRTLEEQRAAAEAAGLRSRTERDRLEQEQRQRQEERARLETRRQAITERGQLLQRLVERARLGEDRQRLAGELERIEARGRECRAIQAELERLPPVAEAELQRLRRLETDLREARARQGALAAGVELRRADTTVLLGGEPLAAGEERRLTGDTELQVGEGVVLRIRPGGGEARSEADRAVAGAGESLHEALRSLGIASLEEAERVARRRTELELRIRPGPAGTPADTDPDSLRRELALAGRRLAELAEELAPLAGLQRRLEQEEDLPTQRQALERIHRDLQRSWSAGGAPLRQLEAELAEFGRQLERRRDDHSRIERDLAGVIGELELRRERRRALQEGHGEAGVLAAAEADLRREVEEAEAALARLRGERAAADGAGGDEGLRRLEARIVTVQEECERLGTDLGAARERCRLLGADDPHAALDAAGAAAEEAEEELRAMRRRTDAHRLLLELFAEARADLSERYSAPLARAVEEYLAPLLPEGPACDLRFDPGGGFTGLRLRRGGETYPFAELSGGMREQLAAALRLSMADVLRGAHDGCLPLLFDDAFTNSDPDRVGVVKAMLRTAVERGLQVILLSCDPSDYEDMAGTVLQLPADRPVG